MASRVAVAALGWAGTVLVVRHLTAAEWGQYSFVFATTALLGILTDFGSSRVVLLRLAQFGEGIGSFLGSYLLLRATLGFVAYLLAVGFVLVTGYPPAVVQAMAFAALALIAGAISHSLEALFQFRLRMGVVAVANVVGQSVQLVCTVLVAKTAPTLLLFVLPALTFDTVAGMWKWRAARAITRFQYGIDLRDWLSILRESTPLAIGAVVVTLASQVDIVMLSRLDTFSAVGLYGVASKFATLVGFLAVALGVPLLTVLVRTVVDDPAGFNTALSRGTELAAVVSGLVLVVFAPFAADIIRLFYGERYVVTAHAALMCVSGQCMLVFFILTVNVLVALRRNRTYVAIALCALLLNVSLNLFLIPALSYNGAAIATLLTQVGAAAVGVGVVFNVRGVRPFPVCALAVVAIATGLAVGLGLLVRSSVPWPYAATLVATLYVVLVLGVPLFMGPRFGSLINRGAVWA